MYSINRTKVNFLKAFQVVSLESKPPQPPKIRPIGTRPRSLSPYIPITFSFAVISETRTSHPDLSFKSFFADPAAKNRSSCQKTFVLSFRRHFSVSKPFAALKNIFIMFSKNCRISRIPNEATLFLPQYSPQHLSKSSDTHIFAKYS